MENFGVKMSFSIILHELKNRLLEDLELLRSYKNLERKMLRKAPRRQDFRHKTFCSSCYKCGLIRSTEDLKENSSKLDTRTFVVRNSALVGRSSIELPVIASGTQQNISYVKEKYLQKTTYFGDLREKIDVTKLHEKKVKKRNKKVQTDETELYTDILKATVSSQTKSRHDRKPREKLFPANNDDLVCLFKRQRRHSKKRTRETVEKKLESEIKSSPKAPLKPILCKKNPLNNEQKQPQKTNEEVVTPSSEKDSEKSLKNWCKVHFDLAEDKSKSSKCSSFKSNDWVSISTMQREADEKAANICSAAQKLLTTTDHQKRARPLANQFADETKKAKETKEDLDHCKLLKGQSVPQSVIQSPTPDKFDTEIDKITHETSSEISKNILTFEGSDVEEATPSSSSLIPIIGKLHSLCLRNMLDSSKILNHLGAISKILNTAYKIKIQNL